jgi:hypothetical protein
MTVNILSVIKVLFFLPNFRKSFLSFLKFNKISNFKFATKIIFAILFIILSNPAISKEKIYQKNYDIMDSIAHQFSDSVYLNCIQNKYNSINFTISELSSTRLIERHLSELCINNNIAVNSDTTALITHNLKLNRFDVSYSNYENSSDSLVRKIVLDGFVTGNNSKFNNFAGQKISYCDTISRELIPFIENPKIEFTRSAVPSTEKTFLQQAVEPFILVSSAILTVIILFSVRSK